MNLYIRSYRVSRSAVVQISRYLLCLGIVAYGIGNFAEGAGSYSASANFSAADNPNGSWSYGWLPSLNGQFQLLTVKRTSLAGGGVVVPSWQYTASQTPAVYCNTSSIAATFANGQAEPGTVYFFAGGNSTTQNFGAIRFIVPETNEYQVVTTVRPLYDSNQGDTDFHVVLDGISLFDTNLAPAQSATFSNSMTLNAQSSLFFAIGRGQDQNVSQSGLKISISIVAVNSPSNPPPVITNSCDIATVVPPGYATVDAGSGSGSGILRDVSRHQTAYGANLFPLHPIVITEIRYRPSAVYGAAFNVTIPNVQVRMSTTTMDPEALSGTFAQNVGSDDTVVFDGDLAVSSAFTGGGSNDAPKDFDIRVPLETPFTYDSSKGNLLIEWRNPAGSTATFVDSGSVIGDGAGRVFGSPSSATAQTVESGAEVIQVIYCGSSNSVPPGPESSSFVVGRDFSPSMNPSGVWTHGWAATIGGAVTPLETAHTSTADNGVRIPSWQLTSYQTPAVYWNDTTNRAVFGYGTAFGDPGEVWFVPGENGRPENYGVIRFTAPSNGNFEIAAFAYPVFPAGSQGDTDFHVVRNGTSLLDRWLNGNQSVSYTGVVALATGETIDMVIGRGADGRQNQSVLKLRAAITPTTNAPTPPPPPPPVALTFDLGRDFSSAANPNLPWAFGWKPALTGSVSNLTVVHASSAGNGVLIPSWQLTHSAAPAVFCNTSSIAANIGALQIPPATVWFVAGENGAAQNFGVIRFTAPTNGMYQIQTEVSPYYSAALQGDTDFHVQKNGDELFVALLAGAESAVFSNVVSLTAGDTVDFVVGRGADESQFNSVLRISAIVGAVSTTAPIVYAPVNVASGLNRVSPNEVEVSIAGALGASYLIEASNDLSSWVPLTTVKNDSPIIRFTDPDAGASPSRFYRARPVAP